MRPEKRKIMKEVINMCYSYVCKDCGSSYIGDSWGALEKAEPEKADLLRQKKYPYCKGDLEVWDSFPKETQEVI